MQLTGSAYVHRLRDALDYLSHLDVDVAGEHLRHDLMRDFCEAMK
jgi:hypothetical protein